MKKENSYDQTPRPVGGMRTLVKNMLGGLYDTPTLVSLLKQYNPNKLSSNDLAACVEGVVDTATYTINSADYSKPLVIPAGTGGDKEKIGHPTVNITTMTGIVMAASEDCIVGLYGNKKATGVLGKMDVLEQSHVNIELNENQVKNLLHTKGIAPLFARNIYPGAKNIAEARQQVGSATLFNYVLPLSAPVTGDARLLLGVANSQMLLPMANIAKAKGIKNAFFVHAENGMDEAYLGPTDIIQLQKGNISSRKVNFGDMLGVNQIVLSDLQAHTPEKLLQLFQEVFDPHVFSPQLQSIRQVVALNAALGMYLAKTGNKPLEKSLPVLYAKAISLLETGKAQQKLREMQRNI